MQGKRKTQQSEIRALFFGVCFPLECENQSGTLKGIVRDSLEVEKFDFVILLTF